MEAISLLWYIPSWSNWISQPTELIENLITILSVCRTFRVFFDKNLFKVSTFCWNNFLMAYLILLTSKNEQCKLNIALLYMRINHVNVFHHFSCIIHEVFFSIREKQIILLCPFHRSRFTQIPQELDFHKGLQIPVVGTIGLKSSS